MDNIENGRMVTAQAVDGLRFSELALVEGDNREKKSGPAGIGLKVYKSFKTSPCYIYQECEKGNLVSIQRHRVLCKSH